MKRPRARLLIQGNVHSLTHCRCFCFAETLHLDHGADAWVLSFRRAWRNLEPIGWGPQKEFSKHGRIVDRIKILKIVRTVTAVQIQTYAKQRTVWHLCMHPSHKKLQQRNAKKKFPQECKQTGHQNPSQVRKAPNFKWRQFSEASPTKPPLRLRSPYSYYTAIQYVAKKKERTWTKNPVHQLEGGSKSLPSLTWRL